ncbi:MAG: hypothetical protein ACQEP1_04990 [Nanobdellota archaeon]
MADDKKDDKKKPPSRKEHLYHDEWDGIEISDKVKDLHEEIHQVLPVKEKEISEKYKGLDMGDLSPYVDKKRKGLGQYIKDVASKTDHYHKALDIENLDEHTLTSIVKDSLEKGVEIKHRGDFQNRAQVDQRAEELLRDYLREGSKEIFDYLKSGLEMDQKNKFREGYLSKVDELSDKHKKEFSAAHASYLNITSFGHHVPKAHLISENPKEYINQTLSEQSQKYSMAHNKEESFHHRTKEDNKVGDLYSDKDKKDYDKAA